MLSENAPVLLVTFNRPDTTQVVFDTIKLYKPKKLYIFSDGPRKDRFESDWSKIQQTRAIFNNIDWDCEIATRFMQDNQGCGKGVSGAINWAFETEEKLIILEDDCVPSISFFAFCNKLLEQYSNDERIMHIAGTRWNEEFEIKNYSYFYSMYAHIWGWATWKRAWKQYDFQMKDWPEFKKNGLLKNILNSYLPLLKRWNYVFDNIYALKEKHTWDYQWQYTIFKNNGLCINPVKNLITNIGEEGVHYNVRTDAHHRDRSEADEVLIGPDYFHAEYDYDRYHGKAFFLRGRGIFRKFYDTITYRIKQFYNTKKNA